MLELKALREGSWKLAEYTTFHSRLTMIVTSELRALLKISPKAHPKLQALLIDLMLYKPKFVVEAKSVAPSELLFQESGSGEP